MSNIFLPISSKEDYNVLVPFCERLARRLDFSLTISTCEDHGLQLKNQLRPHDERVVGSEKNFYKVIESNVNNAEADISMVCIYPGTIRLDANHNCLRFFSRLRTLTVPYFLLPDLIQKNWMPENVFFPICARDGEKEASAWAGFWTRHTGGQLHLVHPKIKYHDKHKAVFANLNFIKRLLEKSGIAYKTLSYGFNKKETVSYSLEMAKRSNSGLLILSANRLNSPEYIFTGPPEKKILKNRSNTPVLFVNPRHDLYLPCG
ncbi:hypothetical protein [Marinilabilia rubra]|uniref:UspA domain-containing protein n=1 Tax=Marinilabilia rubra TaxID=2162893 RepID=A0A2U2BCS3_9BACT|nr:hypothetical protein [Marinilabilia rubra]PWE00875.1 hypothetical protein DDZ16_04615 [Marinilabilia rubra]